MRKGRTGRDGRTKLNDVARCRDEGGGIIPTPCENPTANSRREWRACLFYVDGYLRIIPFPRVDSPERNSRFPMTNVSRPLVLSDDKRKNYSPPIKPATDYNIKKITGDLSDTDANSRQFSTGRPSWIFQSGQARSETGGLFDHLAWHIHALSTIIRKVPVLRSARGDYETND